MRSMRCYVGVRYQDREKPRKTFTDVPGGSTFWMRTDFWPAVPRSNTRTLTTAPIVLCLLRFLFLEEQRTVYLTLSLSVFHTHARTHTTLTYICYTSLYCVFISFCR